MEPDLGSLLHATKLYVVGACANTSIVEPTETVCETVCAPALKRFKYLASRITAQDSATVGALSRPNSDSVLGQINRYVSEAGDSNATSVSDFWGTKPGNYYMLHRIAQDLMAAPASQAYVERIFSLCGMLTAGRRNRMGKSLEMRVFLKLNKDI